MAFNPERIIFLLKEYSDRKATPEEQRELMDWLADYEDDGSFQAYIQQLLNDYPLEKKAEGVDWERIYSAILSKRNDSSVAPVHRVHFLKTSWFRYAAAVVLIAGTAAVWYKLSLSSSPKAGTSSAKDIAPGSEKAVLTLADGSTIILDNAANGNVAQQGNTKIIKLDNGQLAYSPLQKGRGGLSKDLLYNTISTPRGGQYQIVLPDGSKVWLNAASSIRFPTVFSGTERNVDVTGEVYMEIAKNVKQPFKVKANGTEIQVLGTSFNINAYQDEEAVKTTLVDGSVRVIKVPVSGKKQNEGIFLKPSEQAIVSNSDNVPIRKMLVQAGDALAWKDGVFNFNNTNIQTVMRQISRWYDVEVEYRQRAPSKNFSGEIQRDLNLSEVLDVLRDADLHFVVEGRKIIILP